MWWSKRMHEDWMLDEDFQVESSREFFNDLNGYDEDVAFRTMKPCPNCGEFRPKNDRSMKENGVCYLCSKSDTHREKRGMSGNASDNTSHLEGLCKKLEELTEEW